MDTIAYSTQTGDAPSWTRPEFNRAEDFALDPHALCVHSVGYCDAERD